jgi:lipocalin
MFSTRLCPPRDLPPRPSWALPPVRWIHNKETQAEWRVSPKIGCGHLPFRLPYIIIDVALDYSHMTVGFPDRSMLWVMARDPNPPGVDAMLQTCADLGYDLTRVRTMPHPASAAR